MLSELFTLQGSLQHDGDVQFLLMEWIGMSLLIGSLTFLQLLTNCTKKAPAANQSAVAPSVPSAADLKPRVIPKNEKEEMIAKGQLKKGKHDYPTMDDVVSDWDSEKDPKKDAKGKKKLTDTDKKDGKHAENEKKSEMKSDMKKEASKDNPADTDKNDGDKKEDGNKKDEAKK